MMINKILLFLIIGGVMISFSEAKAEDKEFSEIILKGYTENPQVKEIYSLIEEIELTWDEEKMSKTEQILKSYINKEPKNFLYYYFLARCYDTLGTFYENYKNNKKKAKEYFELGLEAVKESIKLNKEFSDAYRLAGDLYGRLIPLKNPMIYGMLYGPRSKRLIKKSVELDPKNPEAYLALGRQYFFTPPAFGGSKKEAEVYYKKAIEVCPSYYLSYIWLGWLYEEKGDLTLAKKNYIKALQLRPESGWAKEKLKQIERIITK